METPDYKVLYEQEKEARERAEARAEVAERKLELVRQHNEKIITSTANMLEVLEGVRKQIKSD